jgi:carbamoyl-phosphate synthase small subunit
MDGRDLVGEVTPDKAATDAANGKPLVCALDTGIKNSILSNLRSRVQLELHPASASAQTLLGRRPRAVFLANGPGDPAALDYIVATVGDLLGKVPVFGICLGHQLVCRALGLETFKLTYGHRGANHPVKDLSTGRIHITSQNHGFSVVGPSGQRALESDEPARWQTAFGVAELSQINLYDRTVEGLSVRDISASTVQYHPEAGPGPHDANFVFERFFELIGA